MQRMIVLAAALVAPLAAEAATFGSGPIVWSHRGSSYLARENTLEAFALSADQGADGFELDLFVTAADSTGKRDLAVFHDPDLNRLTNVEDVFPLSRARDTDGDGTGDTYFIADFTMEELRTLEVDADSRAGRVALQADPRNPVAQPGVYRIPSYAEALDLAEARGQKVLTEVKLTDAGDAAERAAAQELLIAEWTARGYTNTTSPVVVQAFSDIFMQEIDAKLAATPLHVPTVQLNFDAAVRPALPVLLNADPNDDALFPSLLTVIDQAGLEQFIGDNYGNLDGIAVTLDVLLPGRPFSPALNPLGLDFIAAAEANGLAIYGWTFRIDEFATDPNAVFEAYLAALAAGDLSPFFGPYTALLDRGLDGFITDNPDIALAARAEALAPIPLPASVWLLGAGMAALVGLRRR
jgi:glycerophosphoryl diester phosphodiesterase